MLPAASYLMTLFFPPTTHLLVSVGVSLPPSPTHWLSSNLRPVAEGNDECEEGFVTPRLKDKVRAGEDEETEDTPSRLERSMDLQNYGAKSRV